MKKKTRAALEHGLNVILCVGETLEERESGKHIKIITGQVEIALSDLELETPHSLVIAYEPVWAIGTGKTATPEQAQEVHAFIRKLLAEMFGDTTAEETRIQYGGSVKPNNVTALMSQVDIDGALVGGASLKADSFAQIVKF